MLVHALAAACLILSLLPSVSAQNISADNRVSSFDSNSAALTETLLKFADQQHLRIAIEYVDQDSMTRSINISLKHATIAESLDSILSRAQGYRWTRQKNLVTITNEHSTKRAEAQLNTVIPRFDIRDSLTVNVASASLWSELQVRRDPEHNRRWWGGSFGGNSSTIKPATLRNQTVRQILAYIIMNSEAKAWVVPGPPKCLGYTPYCGLWSIIESDSTGTSAQEVMKKISQNL
jgi:hypothetical protein